MCTSCSTGHRDGAHEGEKRSGTITRRSALAGIGGVAAAMGLTACSPQSPSPTTSAAPTSTAPSSGPPPFKLAVVLLGTQAGPPIVADRTGISTALIVDGVTYVVDCGRASATQFRRAGLKFASMKNIFITHLHADHISDYYNFLMLGGGSNPQLVDAVTPPVQVYGPGPAGGLPPAFGGANVATANPANPTPGLAELTQKCNEAYAYSNNVLMRDTGLQDTAAIATVHEIGLPQVGASFTNTAPRMAPFPVMSDDRVKVTATLVPHGPVFPSFAFRFDTQYGSVTFSGDTALNDNIVELAHGSDLLIHEAVNTEASKLPADVLSHMLESHTPVQKVGNVAQQAEVKKLVLSHIADFSDLNPSVLDQGSLDVGKWNTWARQGFKGEAFVGTDLQTVVVK